MGGGWGWAGRGSIEPPEPPLDPPLILHLFYGNFVLYDKNKLLYDWRESCLPIGPICLHKSLCLPGNWSKPVHKLILHKNQLELVSRS